MSQISTSHFRTALFRCKSFLNQYPDTVENVMRAMIDAIGFIQEPGHKNAVLQSLVQWLRLAQTEELADDRIVRKL